MTAFEAIGYPGATVDLMYYEDRQQHRNRQPEYALGMPDRSGGESDTLPMRELAMMILMEQITDIPNWHKKVFDKDTVRRWREEAAQQPEDELFQKIMKGKETEKIPQPRSRIISSEAFSYCIKELRGKAKYYEKTGLIPTLDSCGCSMVKSDSLLTESLREGLVQGFNALREEQAANVDWHPQSCERVQDLVDPSLYPFVYGRSPFINEEVVDVSNAMRFVGQGKPTPKSHSTREPDKSSHTAARNTLLSDLRPHDGWSLNYQSLPSNVIFREDGTAKLSSYINNLHPRKHSFTYKNIEKAINLAIPAWEQCLVEFIRSDDERTAGRAESRFPELDEYYDSDDTLWEPDFSVEEFKDAAIKLTDSELLELDDFGILDCFDTGVRRNFEEDDRRRRNGLPPLIPNVSDESLARAKWKKCRDAILPEPMGFEEIDYFPDERFRTKFNKLGLQVLVKMTSIELTPENPEFPSSGWRLEGQMNEKICATALFYVDSENVTTSHVSFRMKTCSYLNQSISHEQLGYNYMERMLGTSLSHNGECVQTYGDIQTSMGRLLAFPNTFQHKVSSFELRDPSKPGYQRVLTLWLVDPHRRIISTANVPPQQKHWWDGPLGIREQVEGGTPEGLMSIEEAKQHRLRLMDEQSAFSDFIGRNGLYGTYDFN